MYFACKDISTSWKLLSHWFFQLYIHLCTTSIITVYKTSATSFVYGLLLFHPVQHVALAIDHNSSMQAQITKPITIHHFFWDGCKLPSKVKHCTKLVLTQPRSKKKLPINTNTWEGQKISKRRMHEENWEQQNHHIVVTGEKCIMTWSIIVTRRKETKINGSNDLQRNNLTLILPLSPSTLTPPPPRCKRFQPSN